MGGSRSSFLYTLILVLCFAVFFWFFTGGNGIPQNGGSGQGSTTNLATSEFVAAV